MGVVIMSKRGYLRPLLFASCLVFTGSATAEIIKYHTSFTVLEEYQGNPDDPLGLIGSRVTFSVWVDDEAAPISTQHVSNNIYVD